MLSGVESVKYALYVGVNIVVPVALLKEPRGSKLGWKDKTAHYGGGTDGTTAARRLKPVGKSIRWSWLTCPVSRWVSITKHLRSW
jgi:hypothetical protein